MSVGSQSAGSEEDLMAVANSDIAQLCAELIILWQQFMELACRREQVRRSLARQHHTLRVGGSTCSRVGGSTCSSTTRSG